MIRHTVTIWAGRPPTFEEITELAAEVLESSGLAKVIGGESLSDLLHDMLRDGATLDLRSGVSIGESSDAQFVAIVDCHASHGDVQIVGQGEIKPGTHKLRLEYDGEIIAAIGEVGARIDDDADPTEGGDQ